MCPFIFSINYRERRISVGEILQEDAGVLKVAEWCFVADRVRIVCAQRRDLSPEGMEETIGDESLVHWFSEQIESHRSDVRRQRPTLDPFQETIECLRRSRAREIEEWPN